MNGDGHTRPWLDGGDDVTIRRAGEADAAAVRALAVLSSAAPLEGDVIVAEVDGELWAALGRDEGRIVSDPFRATATVRALLALRHRNLSRAQGRPRRVRGGRLLRRFVG